MELPLKLKVIVGKVGNSLRITLPSPITEQLDIKKGDTLALSITNSKILVEKFQT